MPLPPPSSTKSLSLIRVHSKPMSLKIPFHAVICHYSSNSPSLHPPTAHTNRIKMRWDRRHRVPPPPRRKLRENFGSSNAIMRPESSTHIGTQILPIEPLISVYIGMLHMYIQICAQECIGESGGRKYFLHPYGEREAAAFPIVPYVVLHTRCTAKQQQQKGRGRK